MVREIELHHLAKVEGHANLTLRIERGKIKVCQLEALEGARFFEGLIVAKKFDVVQEITTRICGICSCSHTIAAIQAIEDAFKIKVSEQTRLIRELLMIGERIRSHATHLYFMALPDYLGYDSAIEMAKKHHTKVNEAIKLISLGNKIISAVGGRAIHPLNITIGGINRLPKQNSLLELKKELENSIEEIEKTAKLFLELKYPKLEMDVEYLSLKERNSYACISGNIVSDSQSIKTNDYRKHITESLREYSTSKFALKDGKAFTTGAIARINNNHAFLCKKAKILINKYNLKLPLANPFYNNIAQALELVHIVPRAIEIIESLKLKEEKIRIHVKEGHGISAVEAPRGTLFHEYKINKQGFLTYANILTPTVQNLNSMEESIKKYLPTILKKPKKRIILEIEKLIRAYDPCFSCSTHFLKVKWLK
jgi:coenzyme F420-reducing hydrogenase alpha subunit